MIGKVVYGWDDSTVSTAKIAYAEGSNRYLQATPFYWRVKRGAVVEAGGSSFSFDANRRDAVGALLRLERETLADDGLGDLLLEVGR